MFKEWGNIIFCSFSPEKQPRGTDGPVPAKWRHSGASCSYVWRHIFLNSISVNLFWMAVSLCKFILQSIKAMWYNSTFPRTFWSTLVIWSIHMDPKHCVIKGRHCMMTLHETLVVPKFTNKWIYSVNPRDFPISYLFDVGARGLLKLGKKHLDHQTCKRTGMPF